MQQRLGADQAVSEATGSRAVYWAAQHLPAPGAVSTLRFGVPLLACQAVPMTYIMCNPNS